MSLSRDGASYDRTRDEHSWIAVIGFRLIGFLCYSETTVSTGLARRNTENLALC